MIQIIDNFLDKKTCEYLIKYFEENPGKHCLHDTGVNFIEIKEIKEFDSVLKTINDHVFKINKYKIDWIQIVKWFDDCSHGLHFDNSSDKTVYASVSYLNEGYIGGQTFFEEGTIIMPRKGRTLFFNGMKYKHGVMPVKKGPRYVLTGWYKY